MSEETSAHTGPFNLDQLKELIELMEKHGLSEINLRNDMEQWRLKRGSEIVSTVATAAVPVAAAPPPAAASAAGPSDTGEASDGILVKSPIVGTYYSSPTPDDPPFVSVGSKVTPESIVCIVEAMKVFNQIPADVSGTIVEVLVQNGDAVEFNQPLFRVILG